ncbi:putative ribonuclease H-like domain-containing protein [Tanacetum coccineum]|uniref:Ribonuclease H-like domain-containing protein n=1 Tax=Tanacetum coccineum TaxID=301880 RepID=A0ABQ5GQ94_9ASTR
MVTAVKLLVLNPGEFKLWKMRIEQYFLMTDYALWEVIVNGDSPQPKRTVDGVEQTYPPTTAEEKLERKNELKARGTLLMALPNEHQLKFNTYKCAKTLMDAIEKRFGGNKESKKTQKTLLKQQYGNFNGSSSEGLDQTFDKLQNLISQLEIMGETISQEDMNLKFLRSLLSEWKTHTLISRNKPDLDTLSRDDLYKNLKIYETEIDANDLEEMDLKWQMAMLTIRARRFLNKTRGKINANGYEIGFNKSKVECYNCHKKGHFTRECKAPRENRNIEPIRGNVIVETTDSKALVAQDGLGYDWSSLSSSSSDSESQLNLGTYKACLESVEARLDMYKKNEVVFEEDIKILKLDIKLRDNALTELRKKFEKAEKEKDDLKLTLENESVTSIHDAVTSKAKTSVSKLKFVSKPLIEDWISDSEYENETEFKSKQRKPSFAKIKFGKSNEHVKTPRESVKKIKNKKQAKYPRKNSQSLRGNQRNWNNLMTQKLGSNFEFKNKACYECGCFNHLIKDWDLYEKKMVEKTVWNNARRENHQNSERMTHPHPKGNFVPKAVLMKSGIKSLNTAGQNFSKAAVSVNTARPINTAYTRPTVNSARKASNVLNKAHTHVRSPFNKSLKEKVNTVKGDVTIARPKAVVSNNKGNEANVVKASACWVWRPNQKDLDHVFRHNGASMTFKRFDYGNPQLELQEKGVINSGFSRHMTRNKSYLSDYEEIDGRFVAFRGDPKGGRITGKGKISTGGLTRLFAKATFDESNLWHRRLGHINFKTLNKLVKGNLVKDLKVKVIRCDNGTEFKNKVMNQLCEMKGIKREFSVARTPQQNGVAERKNRTLIEAAKTMLADSNCQQLFRLKRLILLVMFKIRSPRIVEENRHVKFSEETPNIIGNGPNWLFDIDALTISINYRPVVAGNQTNGNAGTKENIDACQDGKKIVPDQKYILLPLLTFNSSLSKSLKDSPNAEFKPSREEEKIDFEYQENEDSEVPNTEEPRVNQEQDANVNNTSNINPIVYSDDDDEVGVEADMNNLATNVLVSPILTTRVHKDHPLEQIIGDIHSAPQTRRMTKNVTEHVLNGCTETRKMIEVLWLEIRQDWWHKMDVKSAFLYGTIEEEVYVCQPPGFEDPQFPDKVYKVEKALYSLHQAPIAWYETLSTYLLENRFRRGIIDKTLFIKKDKGELTFFLGLQVKQKDDGIFISQDKYVADILKKFDFATVKTTSTLIETNKALLKDEEAEDVDVHLYRSMIGSLMYLTTSRPDIMFAVCAYARFQVTPKVSHLYAVKRIFRYLKGQPKLGLWYPRDSPFDLEAFSNSDYARASLDRKSTTGGCQFLGKRLISWQCKKQTIIYNSTTEAKYVTTANCCRKAKRITEISQSSGPIHLVVDKTVYKEWEDRMERAATTASSLEAEQDNGNINMTQSMATLNESFPQGTSLGSGPKCQDTILGVQKLKLGLRLNLLLPVLVYAARHTLPAVRHKLMLPGITYYYWASAKAKIINGERQIQALVDKKKVIITETSIRSDLKLDDAEGIDSLPTASIFVELERMGTKTTAWNEFSSTMASAIIYLATNQTFNFSKYIFNNMVKHLEGGVKFLMYPRFVQVFLDKQVEGMTRHKEVYVLPYHTKKVFANMKRPGKDFSGRVTPLFSTMMIKDSEDIEEVKEETEERNLQKKVLDLEKAKTAQAKEIASLKKRVKQSKKRRKLRTLGFKRLSMLEEQEIEFKKVVKEPVSVAITTKSIPVSAAEVVKYTGKGKMVEFEKPLKKKDQIALDEEMARNLKAHNTQAMIEADFELAQRLQAEEQGEITIEERSRLFVELMNRRKNHFAKLKAEEIRRKTPTKAQKRNQMSTYLKNMARFKHSQLKSKNYDEIQKLFDKEMKKVNTFVDMNSEVVKGSETRTKESSKRAWDKLESNKSKKQKIDEHVEAEKDDDLEEEEMKKHMEIVQDEEEIAIDAIPLATKPLMIIEYKIVKEGQKGFYHLIRADGNSKRYSSMIRML